MHTSIPNRFGLHGLVVLCTMAAVHAQPAPPPPIIDMHVHSTNTTPQAVLGRMANQNLRFFFLSGLVADLADWSAAFQPNLYLPGIVFPCEEGRAPITGRSCFGSADVLPDIEWLRGEVQSGRIRAFGELSPQYPGISPNDSLLEPYWQLAEDFDLPVAIHMGPGPQGVAYDSAPVPFKSPNYRMALGDPLLLEEVLLRHKKLRLYVMHAGWPRLEAMLALLYAHPNVYVDVAALSADRLVPRANYYAYLRTLVEAGFGKRIMFGTDFPDQVQTGVTAILEADFLSTEQKSDILCNNAARFLRLQPSTCSP
jgi:Amidohydrolase